MAFHDTLRNDTAALYTDLYQLTMLQAYHREAMHETAVFDLFVRRLRNRNVLLACGLEPILEYLENVSFSEEALHYLADQHLFTDDFLQWLEDFSFTGDVYAVAEGTPVFPDIPLIEVVAPIGEAQLVETFLLNQMTFQTGIASKALRVVRAAKADGTDRLVADFGMRRMHGTDAAMKGARAMYIAGVDSTSNVAAGEAYDIPITGTMAHSYIEAHPDEETAFRAFSDLYPETILLVDTYDTIDGVRAVVDLAHERGEDFQISGIRLDSGDLAELAHEARHVLDQAGLRDVKIVASSGLDEQAIADLLSADAPIDGFGVGTKMGTSADQPYLDSAYKLCGYDGTPRMKLSKEKSNLPGRKQVFRQYNGNTAVRDVIGTADETLDGEPLLHRVMHNGSRTDAGAARPARAIREHAAAKQNELPDELLALDPAAAYPVDISDALHTRLHETRARLQNTAQVQA